MSPVFHTMENFFPHYGKFFRMRILDVKVEEWV